MLDAPCSVSEKRRALDREREREREREKTLSSEKKRVEVSD